MGDRVPPGCTFDYHWNTFSWPSTAGVWLYHDHSIHDMDNVRLGAIGVLVVHNPADPDDVFVDFDKDPAGAVPHLPGGTPNGSVTFTDAAGTLRYRKPPERAQYLQLFHELTPLNFKTTIQTQEADMPLRVADLATRANRDQMINGRKFLGNTPTMVGGRKTKMRFGVVGMNDTTFHTFHLHGHRWVIPGPSGDKVGGEPPFGSGVQTSPLNRGVSQFEDTKIFGPANSFVFTINQGSFMGPPLEGAGALGEWHMHCHVLNHMGQGMMGSLLLIDDSEPDAASIRLQRANFNLVNGIVGGQPMRVPGDYDMCPNAPGPGGGQGSGPKKVAMKDFEFQPAAITIQVGDEIVWTNDGGDTHTATGDAGEFNTGDVAGKFFSGDQNSHGRNVSLPLRDPSDDDRNRCGASGVPTAEQEVVMKDFEFQPPEITIQAGEEVVWQNEGGEEHTATSDDNRFNTGDVGPGASSAAIKFHTPGTFPYHCEIHPAMTGTVVVNPAAGPAPPPKKVAMKNFNFDSPDLTINVGEEVIWENQSPSPHTATNAGGFDTGRVERNTSSGPIKFSTAGTFDYVCNFHSQMKGKITVVTPVAAAAARSDAKEPGGPRAGDGPR